MQFQPTRSVSASLEAVLKEALLAAGGWLPFDRFMGLALYAPGLGYYARDSRQFGHLPRSGSDFVTAPELSPLFGVALGAQVGQALRASGASEVVEFGAGSGALAQQLLGALGQGVRRYTIVELSAALRARQQAALAAYGDRVRWLDSWPEDMHAVVVGNEVLDAMPVQLLCFDGRDWLERGVVWEEGSGWVWQDRPTLLRPPTGGDEEEEVLPWVPGTVTEIHPQAEAFMRGLAQRLKRGAAFFIDYGFSQAEYYHRHRVGGTLMCHHAHRADADPLVAVGEKDITSHVNFTQMALVAQEGGLEVLGYTTQAHFLINCGLLGHLVDAHAATRANAQKLLTEHEMGELFKVLGLARGCDEAFLLAPLGFARGDRTHTL